MKKTFLLITSLLIIVHGGLCYATTDSGQSIFSGLKDAIVSDVSSTVTSGVNSIKLTTYQTQLAQKQQELEELEASSKNVFVKYFKKVSLNRNISELEAKIKELE